MWALGASYASIMCLAIAVNLIPVFLTTLNIDLGGVQGLTKEQLGRMGGMTFAGVVAGVLLAGPLADRWGPKPFVCSGNVLISLGIVLLGTAPGYHAVLVAVLVMGFGAGVLDMVLSPIVCALQPSRRAAAMNWLHSFYCIGSVVTILTTALALKMGVGWRTITLVLAPVPLLVAAGFGGLTIPALVREGAQRMRLRQLVRIPYFGIVLVAIFLAGATELGMAQWLPAYAEYTLGYSKWTGGMALLAFSVAMAVGRLGAGALATRYSAFQMMSLSCWISIGLYLVVCFAPWRVVAMSACIALGLAVSCLWPSMLGLTGDRFSRGGASMFGVLAAMGNFGGLFMPWAVGATADVLSLRWGLSMAALCPLLMLMALRWMRRHDMEPALERGV